VLIGYDFIAPFRTFFLFGQFRYQTGKLFFGFLCICLSNSELCAHASDAIITRIALPRLNSSTQICADLAHKPPQQECASGDIQQHIWRFHEHRLILSGACSTLDYALLTSMKGQGSHYSSEVRVAIQQRTSLRLQKTSTISLLKTMYYTNDLESQLTQSYS